MKLKNVVKAFFTLLVAVTSSSAGTLAKAPYTRDGLGVKLIETWKTIMPNRHDGALMAQALNTQMIHPEASLEDQTAARSMAHVLSSGLKQTKFTSATRYLMPRLESDEKRALEETLASSQKNELYKVMKVVMAHNAKDKAVEGESLAQLLDSLFLGEAMPTEVQAEPILLPQQHVVFHQQLEQVIGSDVRTMVNGSRYEAVSGLALAKGDDHGKVREIMLTLFSDPTKYPQLWQELRNGQLFLTVERLKQLALFKRLVYPHDARRAKKLNCAIISKC